MTECMCYLKSPFNRPCFRLNACDIGLLVKLPYRAIKCMLAWCYYWSSSPYANNNNNAWIVNFNNGNVGNNNKNNTNTVRLVRSSESCN